MTAPDQQPQQFTYQDALIAAAALQAATASDDTKTSIIGHLSDQIATVRDRAAAWVLGLIEPLWTPLNPYDGAAVQAFTQQAGRFMVTAQAVVSGTAAAAQTQQLSAMGFTAPTGASDPADVRRVDFTEDGIVARPATSEVDYSDGERQVVNLDEDATTEGMFNRPARTYRYLESKGVDVERARAEAFNRIVGLVEGNLMLAQRLAEAEVIAGAAGVDKRIIGLRRIIHPELSRTGVCGLCIAASDQVYKVTSLLPIHDRCKCTVAAVTRDFDPADVLNQADLKAVYAAAGSRQSRELKRVRFQLDEHGELGAVLVPAKPFKPRTPEKRNKRDARQLARADVRFPQRPKQAI